MKTTKLRKKSDITVNPDFDLAKKEYQILAERELLAIENQRAMQAYEIAKKSYQVDFEPVVFALPKTFKVNRRGGQDHNTAFKKTVKTDNLQDNLNWLSTRSTKGTDADIQNNLIVEYVNDMVEYLSEPRSVEEIAGKKVILKAEKNRIFSEHLDKREIEKGKPVARYPVFRKSGQPDGWFGKNLPALFGKSIFNQYF